MDQIPIDDLVDKELTNNLFIQSPQTLIVGLIAGLILLINLNVFIDDETPLYWFTALAIISALRMSHVLSWKFQVIDQTKPIHKKLYFLGTLVAGFTWASLILLYQPGLHSSVQLFIIIVLVGIPSGSLSTNSIHFPLFLAFALPQLAAIIYWTLVLAPGLSIYFTLMALTYSFLLIATAFKLNKYLNASIRNRIYNQALLTEVNTVNTELAELAYVDSLTSIHNRRYFIEQSFENIQQMNEAEKAHTIYMLLDLDKFKSINDSLGHHIGDGYLIEIAQRIKRFAEMKKQPLYARLGGDEFILSYQMASHSSIEKDVNQLIELLQKPVLVENEIIKPQVSIGISEYPYQGQDISSLLRFADKAMYKAKEYKNDNSYYLCSTLDESTLSKQ